MFVELYILFLITYRTVCNAELDTCGSFEVRTDHLNVHLVGHSISEITVPGHHDCVRECMFLSVCQSIDYYGKNKTCKLKDVDSTAVLTSEFTPLSGGIFTDISIWPRAMVGSCGVRPCTVTQRCIPSKNDYYCMEIECKHAPPIDHGDLILEGRDEDKFLDTATVDCEAGYTSSQSSVKCQMTGKWEQATCSQDTSSTTTTTTTTTTWSTDSAGTTTTVGTIMSDCLDILRIDPTSVSGVYQIMSGVSNDMIQVYCDMETDGGGWTVFQKRFDGSTDFYLDMLGYENGFGSINGEFWLGLKYIKEIADLGDTDVRIDISTANGSTAYETIAGFKLEGTDFKLRLGDRFGSTTGVPAEGFLYNSGFGFSTYDVDADGNEDSCAQDYYGAFWYGSCTYVNLNGRYCTPGYVCDDGMDGVTGMYFHAFAYTESLKTSSMMIRRNDN